MATYSRSRIIPHSAERMFGVIAAVEDWPAILREIREVRIESREPSGPGSETLQAVVALGSGFMRMTPRHEIVLDRANFTLRAVSRAAPFETLDIAWVLEPVNDASCQSDFEATCVLSSRLLNAALNIVGVETVFRKATAKFVHRADAVYGTGGTPG